MVELVIALHKIIPTQQRRHPEARTARYKTNTRIILIDLSPRTISSAGR